MTEAPFAYFVDKFGAPTQAIALDQAKRDAITRTLPKGLIDYWHTYGIGVLQQGRFQFCEPDDLDEILEFVFGQDEELDHSNLHVFGYSAFGELHVWSPVYSTILVNLLTGEVYGGGLTSAKILATREKLGPDRAIFLELSMIEAKTYDGVDRAGKPLLKRAQKRLGPLERGECYGFVPALPLGGEATLENLRKLRALEHFAILAQAQQFVVTDYQTGVRKIIREIRA